MADKKIRVGFIGCGGIAHDHIMPYLKFDDVELIGGADLIPGRAEEFFKEFGVEGAHCYTDYREFLEKEKPDAVSICTYNRQHACCTIDALNAGVNVLLEKPFSVTLDEAVDMMRAEKKSGKILTVGFQPRFSRNMQEIKKICESGVLGKIYYIQTGGGRRHGIPYEGLHRESFIMDEKAGIGALADIGCYSLDMVLNAIGYPTPLTVDGYVSDYFGKNPKYYDKDCNEKFSVDDFGAAFIRLEGGIILDFRISWAIHMDTPGDTLILGTDGGLRIPSTDCWNGSIGGPMTLYHDVGGLQTQTTIPMLDEQQGLFWQKCRSFIDAVKTGGKAPIPTSQIIKNQAIIDGISRSAKLGHAVDIKIPEI